MLAALAIAIAAATIDVNVWLPGPTVYVDFAWVGKERGTEDRPFDTLDEGLAAVGERGVLRIEGATARTGRIDMVVRIEAWQGDARIGDSDGLD